MRVMDVKIVGSIHVETRAHYTLTRYWTNVGATATGRYTISTDARQQFEYFLKIGTSLTRRCRIKSKSLRAVNS
jgi:hypothetical protein